MKNLWSYWQKVWDYSEHTKRLTWSFLVATTLLLLRLSNVFYDSNQLWNDMLYQSTSITNPDICIIGIDGETIDTLGSFPFDREIYADLINLLNESDVPPMAIAIDVLFTGESHVTSDLSLINAVSNWDNIVLACSGNYGSALVYGDNGDFFLASSTLLSMNYPFPSLKDVSKLAHINSTLDQDGILRYGILTIENEEGEVIPSLALAMYQLYCQNQGIPLGALPDNNWYVPFTAKSGGYSDGYSLSKVLSGEIPSSVFANKLVFIGPYTVGLQDHFYTAIDHTNHMYGVEFQANSLEALMNQQFINHVSPLLQNLFLLIAFLLLFFFTLNMKLQHSGLILGISLGVYVLLCKQLYTLGYLVDVFYLPLGCIILYLILIVINALRDRLERARVTTTFKRYVAPEIVDQIFEDGVDNLKLGGITTDVAVMFIDVRNFTPMSEKFPPETVVEILNELLDSMSQTIMDNGGTLDKFIGDAIMCFWGAPLPQEDYIKLSVETAVQIAKNLKPIQANVKKNHHHNVSVGIGIHCGTAVVGNIGSKKRMDFTAIGDTVNTAARLESSAKGDTHDNIIHISEDVYDHVKNFNEFQIEEIEGGLPLKGIIGELPDGKVPAYRVIGRN
ncbi:MAG: adenylate/guanylate cyclase domain-containing protein [Eubacteriales bacterium]